VTGMRIVGGPVELASVRGTSFDEVWVEVPGFRPPFAHGVVRRPDAVAVLPYDLGRGVAFLCRQPRVPFAGALIVEACAGKIDDPADGPLETARRELQEELGFRADRWTTVAEQVAVSPGYTDERMWLYLAEGLTEVQKRACDGYIETITVSLSSISTYVSRYRKMAGADLKTLALLLALQAELAK
jgi:ADP-ribose pyrophosphatase